jgi:hypothetical protein
LVFDIMCWEEVGLGRGWRGGRELTRMRRMSEWGNVRESKKNRKE